jgi:MYXO-CTERM domain-containing protein
LDSGSGKIESRTRFTFKVTRAHGYEAGEYKVTIRDARNGQMVGTAQTLKLQGENEIVDRRAMVFSGEKKKKPEEKKEADASGDKPASDDSKAAGDEKKTDDKAADEPKADSSEEKTDGDHAPPPVSGKPGGCGCTVVSGEGMNLAGVLTLVGLGTLLVRRRRAA